MSDEKDPKIKRWQITAQSDWVNRTDLSNIEKVLMSLAESRGNEGFSEVEGEIVVEWANKVELEYRVLQLVLENKLLIDVKAGDDIVFGPKP